MADCFDYLNWRGDIPFHVAAFNEVDGMILSRFSYFPFEIVGGNVKMSIGEASEKMLAADDLDPKLVMKDDRKLIEALVNSSRFSELIFFGYENKIDKETETQFSAVTINVLPGLYYIAFRGTDNTFVGWKENFNMSFTLPVPAQKLAVEYIERMARRLRGMFICGGHSKGGNLAVYGASFCRKSVQKRIVAVENFDGPGFDERVLSQPGYVAIRERVTTYVPKSSVVGMLLSHEEEYMIVDSSHSGLLQHDTYSWLVERDHFKYLQKVTDTSRFLDLTLKEWISSISHEKRELFIDALYDVISETKVHTLSEFSENWLSNTLTVARSIRKLDDDTKKLLHEVLFAFAKGAGKIIYAELQN